MAGPVVAPTGATTTVVVKTSDLASGKLEFKVAGTDATSIALSGGPQCATGKTLDVNDPAVPAACKAVFGGTTSTFHIDDGTHKAVVTVQLETKTAGKKSVLCPSAVVAPLSTDQNVQLVCPTSGATKVPLTWVLDGKSQPQPLVAPTTPIYIKLGPKWEDVTNVSCVTNNSGVLDLTGGCALAAEAQGSATVRVDSAAGVVEYEVVPLSKMARKPPAPAAAAASKCTTADSLEQLSKYRGFQNILCIDASSADVQVARYRREWERAQSRKELKTGTDDAGNPVTSKSRAAYMELQDAGKESTLWTASGTMVASNEEILVVVYTGEKQFNLTASGTAGAVLDINGLQSGSNNGSTHTAATNETGTIVALLTPRTPGSFEVSVTQKKAKSDDLAGTTYTAEYVVVGRSAGTLRVGAGVVTDFTPTYGAVVAGGDTVVRELNDGSMPHPELIIGWRPYLQPAFRVSNDTAQRDLREAYYPSKACLVTNLPCAGPYLGLAVASPGNQVGSFDLLTGAYLGVDLEFSNAGSIQVFGGVHRTQVLMAPFAAGDSVSSMDDVTEMALRPAFGVAISVSPKFFQALPGTGFDNISSVTGGDA